ncbi:ECF transporter S component [Caproiciproducens sp.]|uniref:ECF transporter S component n=1 Tax=Caproiciproducens sp. TaxID=1954376 RepID=UPI0028988ED8|nr:ECF transporter S component [Caproiciproducens sp.]
MKFNTNQRKTTVNIALTGLMGALVLVGTYLNVPIPVLGDKTMIGLGNVFCILSGLLLGPVYGGRNRLVHF